MIVIMKIGNYFYYVKKRLFYKKKLLFFNVLIASLGLSILGVVFVCLLFLNNFREEAYHYISRAPSNCGVADFSSSPLWSNPKEMDDFLTCLEKIAETKEIESIGSWYTTSLALSDDSDSGDSLWQQMIDISNQHDHLLDNDGNSINYAKKIETVCMPPQVFSFCAYKWFKGDRVEMQKNKRNLLYLGYYFKDIPLGTIFYNEENGQEYEVVGILQKGSKQIYCDSIIGNWGGVQISCADSLDNMILWVPPYDSRECIYASMNLFSCAEGYEYEDGVRAIQKVAEQYNCTVPCGGYQDRINTILSDPDWMLHGLEKLSVLLIMIAFMILLVTQMLLLGLKQRELGIWLISGLSRTKVYWILFGENFIKLGAASCAAFGVVQILCKNLFKDNMVLAHELRGITQYGLGGSLFIISILLSAGISCFAIRTLKHRSIMEQLYSG